MGLGAAGDFAAVRRREKRARRARPTEDKSGRKGRRSLTPALSRTLERGLVGGRHGHAYESTKVRWGRRHALHFEPRVLASERLLRGEEPGRRRLTEDVEHAWRRLEGGEGELRIPGRQAIPVTRGCVVYSPLDTEHEVVNTGEAALTYLVVVATVSLEGAARAGTHHESVRSSSSGERRRMA